MPNNAAFDIGSVLQQATNLTNQNKQVVADIQTIDNKMADTSNEIADAILGGTNKQGVSIQEVLAAKNAQLTKQADLQEVKVRLGLDGEGSASLQNRLATELNSNIESKLQLMDQIKAKENVSFLDDTLGYIMNQFTLPDDYKSLEQVTKKEAAVRDSMAAIGTFSNQAEQAVNVYSKVLTEDAKNATIAAQQSDIKSQALSSQLNALRDRSNTRQQIYQLNSLQFSTLVQARQALLGEESMQLQRQSAARAEAAFNEAQEEKRDKKAGDAALIGYYNSQAKLVGLPELNDVTFKQALLFNKEGVESMARQGYVNSATGSQALGNTPAQVLQTLSSNRIPVPAVEKPTAAVFDEAQRKLQDKMSGKDLNPAGPLKFKTKEEYNQALNAEVAAIASGYSSEVDMKNANNPYNPPPPSAIAPTKVVADTAFFQKVLAPQIQAGALKESDPNRIASLGLDAVVKGNITTAEFTDGMTKYFNAAIFVNSTTKKYDKYALPAQTKMTASLTLPRYFTDTITVGRGTKMPVVLTDPVSVNNFVAKAKSDSLRAGYSLVDAISDLGGVVKSKASSLNNVFEPPLVRE